MEIKRDYYLNKLISKQNNGLIKIVTGIRRCGKSYLLDPMFKNYLLSNGVKEDHIIKIDLDIRENKKYLDPDVLDSYIKEKLVDNEKYYIILDEVQKIVDFESVLNGLLKIKNVDVYVTGSNSKFLSSDIVTEFRGRGDEIKIYPLSFKEFYSVYDTDKVTAWKDYITYGGLPLVILQKEKEEKINYLNFQTNNVYLNDVIERNNIINDKELYELVQMISSSVGSLTNPTKLYNTFVSKGSGNIITDKTIYSYLGYLEDAFIIQKSLRYDIKGKKYLTTPFKFYPEDVGLRNARINFRQMDKGFGIETVVYNELRSRGYAVDVGMLEIRETNKDSKIVKKQKEIDFIVRQGSNEYYIQVMDTIPNGQHGENEYNNLFKVPGSFKKIAVINEYFKAYWDNSGILIISLEEFLLNQDSLNL